MTKVSKVYFGVQAGLEGAGPGPAVDGTAPEDRRAGGGGASWGSTYRSLDLSFIEDGWRDRPALPRARGFTVTRGPDLAIEGTVSASSSWARSRPHQAGCA